MALFTLTDCTAWVHDRDFTTDSTSMSLAVEVEQKEATTFRPATDPDRGWRALRGGLRAVEANGEGLWDAAPDLAAWSGLGMAERVATIAPTSEEGSTAYAFLASSLSYECFGEIGELAPFSLGLKGSNGVGAVRGQVAKAKGDVSATGTLGSALNLGAVGAGQFLYATLHVFAAATTITVVLESDDNAGFSSATTRATFGPITTTGGFWATRVAGPLAETHYRLRVSSITGAFTAGGVIAIN